MEIKQKKMWCLTIKHLSIFKHPQSKKNFQNSQTATGKLSQELVGALLCTQAQALLGNGCHLPPLT